MDDSKLINLQVYGTTCRMRLWADNLVIMQSEADFKRIVKLIVKNEEFCYSNIGRSHLSKLKTALNDRLEQTRKFNPWSMRKADITRSRRQIERRIAAVEDIMKKNGAFDVWESL